MKKVIALIAITGILYACGGEKKVDGLVLANEVCDCKWKTKGMKYNDPERMKIWKSCLDLQGANFKKLTGNKDAAKAYSKRLKECLDELTAGK
ncbi:MAG: hypothetical protein IPL84_00985 [Chitinophagaceae bacterium]|nr:hypothetical protein [Chitinophagaceae bacterium]